MLTLILARARNGAIGLDNALPWHLPEDLGHFKRSTMGATLLMGRRTWESIGRPLPGRTLVVLSRRPLEGGMPAGAGGGAAGPLPPGIIQERDLDTALARHGAGERELFVIGGADLYRQTLPRADRILLTEIDSEPRADTFFDVPFGDDWSLVSREDREAADGTRFAWLDLRRRRR